MIISLKDGAKLFGIAAVIACAAFVSTFFWNYYLDAVDLKDTLQGDTLTLYNAQLLSAQLTNLIALLGLGLIAVAIAVFYVGLYVENHASSFGILKALGYSDGRIARDFWVFGLSGLVGGAVGHGAGYAFAPLVYEMMAKDLFTVPMHYHFEITLCWVLVPAIVMAGVSILCAFLKLRTPVHLLLKGKAEKVGKRKPASSDCPFLRDMTWAMPASHKLLTFFVAIASWCYGSMLQMGWSMKDLSSVAMGVMMLVLGILLAVIALVLAFTSLCRANRKSVVLMRAYGYTTFECSRAVFWGFRPFAYLGFAVGTAYQYGLLRIMLDFVFNGVEGVPDYSFDVGAFFVTLVTFAVFYELATLYFTYRMCKTNVRQLSQEN